MATIRIEHSYGGQHRSTFNSYETVEALARNIVNSAQEDHLNALVVTYEGKSVRLVPDLQAVEGKEKYDEG